MKPKELLNELRKRANKQPTNTARMEGWERRIKWNVDGEVYFWSTERNMLVNSEEGKFDIALNCTKDTLNDLVEEKLSLFVGLWATDRIEFQGSFSDAFRLGYVFLDDNREKKLVFLAHCFLNGNTRFPGGSGFSGGNLPLVNTIMETGVGIVQLPCPEYECLGLEKYEYGELTGEDLRKCFRETALPVVNQMKQYRKFGYDILGVIGMNPSPSCGVEETKGKGTMLGIDRDTSEEKGSGVFIEELKGLAEENGLDDVPFIGFRRTLPGEKGLEEKLDDLREKIG